MLQRDARLRDLGHCEGGLAACLGPGDDSFMNGSILPTSIGSSTWTTSIADASRAARAAEEDQAGVVAAIEARMSEMRTRYDEHLRVSTLIS